MLNDDDIRGFWDETLFPAIKDLVRYGADTLANSDTLDELIDAFVDSAAGTLGYMAPEFLPAIMAAAKEVKDPLHSMADRAISAAQDWSKKPTIKHIGGITQPDSMLTHKNIGCKTQSDFKMITHGDSVLEQP